MSQGAFRELITRLSLSAGALTAVGVAIDAKVTGDSLEPEIQLHVDGVLDALGARDAIKELGAAELRPVLAPWLLSPVEHVGSTAIPGLVAKPVIDLMAQVADTDAVAVRATSNR
jgi:hypothetical protein